MLKIPHTALASALSRAEKIVESRNTIPILSMVRLEAENDQLLIVTTNLDIEFRQTVPCSGSLDACCVDAKRLAQMASVASKEISMELEGHTLTVKSGRSRWAAPVLRADDFPVMPTSDLSKPIQIDGAELSSIIDRTVWAVSNNLSQAYISGVCFNEYEGRVSFTGTNGYVMAVIDASHKWPGDSPNVIVSPQFLRAMQGSASGTCSLSWDERKMRFVCGDVIITGKMIEGPFPAYRKAIPKPSTPVAVDADELIGAVKRVRIASDAKERKLRIRRADGSLHIRIEGTAGFEAEEEVQADCEKGFETGVNADFLAGVLGALDTDSLTIEQDGPQAAMLIRPTSQRTDMAFTGVVQTLMI